MIIRFGPVKEFIYGIGLVILLFLVMGCQFLTIFRPLAVERNVEKEFQRATLFLKQQEHQKAAEAYLHIAKEYPQHPRAQEAGILGQELQRLVSLTASKETALKNLREMAEQEDLKEMKEKAKR